MKKLVGFAVVALLVVGIVKVVHGRSPEAKAHKACEQIAELCGAAMRRDGVDFTRSDIDECTADLAKDGPKELGDKYEPLIECIGDADSCGEIVGCAGGAFADELDDQLHGFSRGFGRMMKH